MSKKQINTLKSTICVLKEKADVECPMVRLLGILSSKWAFPILYHLIQANGPMRFNQLQRQINKITQKELTKQLRFFEKLGLVNRVAYMEMPLRVEYSITDYGKTLSVPLSNLAEWGATHSEILFHNASRI